MFNKNGDDPVIKIGIVMYGKKTSVGGGAERRFARLSNFAAAQYPSLEIHLIANRYLIDLLRQSEICMSSLVIHEIEPDTPLLFNIRLIQVVTDLHLSCVHLVLFQKMLLPFYGWLRMNTQTHYIQTIADSSFIDIIKGKSLRGFLYRSIVGNADLVDCLYPRFGQNEWLSELGSKVRITPCSFTDFTYFSPRSKEDVVAFVGRLVSDKNPLFLVEAANILNKQNLVRDWTFVILGDGPLLNVIVDDIKRKGLESSFLILSAYSSREVLSKSSIFVSLQKRENYPSQSLLEAMSCENAIIATNVGDTRRIVTPECGLLIDDSPRDLARALAILMNDDALRKGFGANARSFASRTQRLDTAAEYMFHLWQEAYRIGRTSDDHAEQ